jgi:FKBP-type peptidyl-prolyl cis-trans isomerase
MKITPTGVAIALAVVVALGMLFFGPRLFNHGASQDAGTQLPFSNQQTPAMQDANGAPTNPGQPIAQSASGSVVQPADLTITDSVVGTGATAATGDTVTVKYTGRFTNGQVFDSTDKQGGKPFTFPLGAGKVIQGWDQGIVGMKVGGKRQLVIPSGLGYGPNDYGPIPGGSTLIFDVELVSIQGK